LIGNKYVDNSWITLLGLKVIIGESYIGLLMSEGKNNVDALNELAITLTTK
jgi:hypothetical protein